MQCVSLWYTLTESLEDELDNPSLWEEVREDDLSDVESIQNNAVFCTYAAVGCSRWIKRDKRIEPFTERVD